MDRSRKTNRCEDCCSYLVLLLMFCCLCCCGGNNETTNATISLFPTVNHVDVAPKDNSSFPKQQKKQHLFTSLFKSVDSYNTIKDEKSKVVSKYVLSSKTADNNTSAAIDIDRLQFQEEPKEWDGRALIATDGTFNITAFAALFERLYGPQTFPGHIGVVTSISAFRIIGVLSAGIAYSFIRSQVRGHSRILNAISFYFKPRNFEFAIGRVFRNWSLILFGRLLLDLVAWGPTLTYMGFFQTVTIQGWFNALFANSNTFFFILDMTFESIFEVLGWITLAGIGNMGFWSNNPLPKRRKRDTRNIWSEHAEIDIETNFLRVVDNLYTCRIDDYSYSEACVAENSSF